jgi:hypothetical protein
MVMAEYFNAVERSLVKKDGAVEKKRNWNNLLPTLFSLVLGAMKRNSLVSCYAFLSNLPIFEGRCGSYLSGLKWGGVQ